MMKAKPKNLGAAITLFFVFVSSFAISISTAMADSDETSSTLSIASSAASSRPAVHIVYTEKPRDQDPKDFHIRTLASALGSEEAARDALVYSYRRLLVDSLQSSPPTRFLEFPNNRAFYRLFQTARSGCTVKGFCSLP